MSLVRRVKGIVRFSRVSLLCLESSSGSSVRWAHGLELDGS